MINLPSTPRSDEDATSQLPALKVLINLGWRYLTPEQALALRGGRTSDVILYGVLEDWLRTHNRIEYRGESVPFTEANIASAIANLRDEEDDGLVRTNEKIYDHLLLGKSLKQTVLGDSKSFQLKYIDWDVPENNIFHVTEEFPVDRPGLQKTYRPDLVLFVNGIPLGVIECKRGDTGPGKPAPVIQAIEQHIRNQKPDGIPKLYWYSQILGAFSPAGTPLAEGASDEYKSEAKLPARYATTGTPRKFWAGWRETAIADGAMEVSEETVEAAVNDCLPPDDLTRLLRHRSAGIGEDFRAAESQGRLVTEQDRLLCRVFSPQRLLRLSHRYIVFDAGVKKIARYQQYFCVEKIRSRIRTLGADGMRRGGVVWHTQGSGKSLTMVMLAKAIAMDRHRGSLPGGDGGERIVLVTDRVDLDDQIYKTFKHCGLKAQQANKGSDLVRMLKDTEAKIITTVINKFDAAFGREQVSIDDPNVFVLVDEGHRTQFGIRHSTMRRVLPNACYIGFTGTPVRREDRSTVEKFGGLIDSYTIKQAEQDRAVLPIVYEGRHVVKDVNQAEIDDWFDKYTEGLSDEQRQDLRRKLSTEDQVMQADPVIRRIARDVSEHYRNFLQGTGFKAQLVAPSKAAAIRYKHWLDDLGEVRSEVLISPPDDREGDEDIYKPNRELVNRFWDGMLQRFGTDVQYAKQLVNSFKHGDTRDPESDAPEIMIVVDKLLTGFDAPENTVLYLARKLREHNLLQAIARVNRLATGKERGYVLDYRGVLEELDDAFAMYSRDANDPESADLGFVESLASIDKAWDDLPQRHSLLWDTFKDLAGSRDREAYEQHVADEALRIRFYERYAAFARVLDVALSSHKFLAYTPEKTVAKYRADLKFFGELRRAVRIRYAEVVDFSEYEPKIRKLLDQYITASSVESITGKIDLYDRDQRAAALEAAGSASSKAETIASNVSRVLEDRTKSEDPATYRRLSAMLREIIERMREGWLAAADALIQIEAVEEEVVRPTASDVPSSLKETRLGAVVFRNIKDILGPAAEQAALAIDRIIHEKAIVGWAENGDCQKEMRQAIDDFLFDLSEQTGSHWSIETIDQTIDVALERARAVL
ncbi:MAG: HsdR family type I site-specific deoxyribonuclease [Phycisphaerales bacterium]|nr:type I restriction endonuclease subunit R [Planctomycetota bacterium]MCH8507152.1 HsdR family type I site-specific deoxyribonuclease [Phycisphaerales bacterium]